MASPYPLLLFIDHEMIILFLSIVSFFALSLSFEKEVKVHVKKIKDRIGYDRIRYDTIGYDTIRYDTIYDTIRYDSIGYDTIRFDRIRYQ